MQIHASCAAREGHGVLLLGPSGAGKSDLLLRLLDRGFDLVADDRVDLEAGIASAPQALAGLLEIRGIGVVRLPYIAAAPVSLAVELRQGERLPAPSTHAASGRPLVHIDPASASAPQRVSMALDCALGRTRQVAGAFYVTPRRVVLVTGLSGAGRSSILRVLEDLGYEAVDNPPLTLTEELASRGDRPVAIGIDARSRGFDAAAVLSTIERLRLNQALHPELVFATADEGALLRRYTETRRRHPLAPEGRVLDGIAAEATMTAPLREAADLVIDTSGTSLSALRRIVETRFSCNCIGLVVSLMSFAYPHGLPREADLVFDARFLRNPHYDPYLRPKTGLDSEVAAYVEADPDFQSFDQIEAMLRLLLPRFVQEGKKYVTIAIGCTGGRHRSVHIVEKLAARMNASGGVDMRCGQITVAHRELQTEAAMPPQAFRQAQEA